MSMPCSISSPSSAITSRGPVKDQEVGEFMRKSPITSGVLLSLKVTSQALSFTSGAVRTSEVIGTYPGDLLVAGEKL